MKNNVELVRSVYAAFAKGDIPSVLDKATGKSFSAPFAHVWKILNGKAVSFHQYTDTAVHQRPLQ